MARISALEESECIRAQEAIDTGEPTEVQENGSVITESSGSHKYVPTQKEVHEAFDTVNTLRYSQPAHLQGELKLSTQCPVRSYL